MEQAIQNSRLDIAGQGSVGQRVRQGHPSRLRVRGAGHCHSKETRICNDGPSGTCTIRTEENQNPRKDCQSAFRSRLLHGSTTPLSYRGKGKVKPVSGCIENRWIGQSAGDGYCRRYFAELLGHWKSAVRSLLHEAIAAGTCRLKSRMEEVGTVKPQVSQIVKVVSCREESRKPGHCSEEISPSYDNTGRLVFRVQSGNLRHGDSGSGDRETSVFGVVGQSNMQPVPELRWDNIVKEPSLVGVAQPTEPFTVSVQVGHYNMGTD